MRAGPHGSRRTGSQSSRLAGAGPVTRAVVTIRATKGLGARRLMRGHPKMMRRVSAATRTAHGLSVSKRAANARHFPRNSAGSGPMRSPRKSLTSPEKMIRAMPLVKPIGDGVRDELDRAAQARQTEPHEDQARHERRDGEPVHAVLLDDRAHDHHERTGGPTDLDARASERRDQESGDDRGGEAPLGGHAARDRERDGERQRHDADDHARTQIGEELRAGVALERRGELRDEGLQASLPACGREGIYTVAARAGACGAPGPPRRPRPVLASEPE